MKRTLVMMCLASLILASASFAVADPSGDATVPVFIVIDPNIAIVPLNPYVDMGTWQTGEFTGIIPFRVDANTEQVKFSVAASHLYKGGIWEAPTVAPILVYEEDGIAISAELGNPTGGDDHIVTFLSDTDIDGFPARLTEEVTFESSQAGHFSQNVELTVGWTQPDPEKPMGQYDGKVRLFASVVLP
ncbi:MAG: hypothetical protein KAW17_03865 [Candidatus Eisenbacteria sp.]|nr:hypothetical protein [Candidatus Eisenbacteria bacterium]